MWEILRAITGTLPSQDCGLDTDLALMGVPCQLFSKLNNKSKEAGYNPFTQSLAGIVRGILDIDLLEFWIT